MNFAVIGLGSFGIKRAQAIKNSKLAKLICIFDTNETNAKKASEDLGVPIKGYDEILNNKEIDVICVCTPNKFHKDIIIESLKAGKHVFCEKPLSKSLKEAKEIYEAAKNSNKTLQVGSNHRFFESVLFAKKLVDKGTIGEVLGDSVHYIDPMDPNDIANSIKKILEDSTYRKSLIEKGNLKLKENTNKNNFSNFFKIIENYRKYQKTWIL